VGTILGHFEWLGEQEGPGGKLVMVLGWSSQGSLADACSHRFFQPRGLIFTKGGPFQGPGRKL